MRYLVVALMLSLAMPAQANQWWVPSPLSLAITVGQWMMRDRVEVFYVQTRSTAATEREAREQAFMLAVDMAVGSLMVTSTDIRNGEVTRRDIVNYSSGYIHEFAVVSRRSTPQGIEVTVDVWVKKSSIADRLLSESRGTNQFDNDKLVSQHQSVVREREQGDRLLEQVLSDYPRRAFDVQVQAIRTRLGSRRELIYEVELGLAWSVNYLRALHEAVDATAVARNVGHCLTARCPWQHVMQIKYRPTGDFFISGTVVAFDDEIRVKLFERYFNYANPHIMVRLHDGYGRTAYQGCFQHAHLTWTNYLPSRRFVNWSLGRSVIDGQLITNPRLEIEVPANTASGAQKIDVEIVPESQCRAR